MITALICVVSIAAFGQFFLIYCRFVLTHSAGLALSDDVLRIACADAQRPGPDDFARILGLMHFCPDAKTQQKEICAVGAYYKGLLVIDLLSRALPAGLGPWAEGERRQCSYFAAVVLDQRISSSRSLRLQSATTV